MASRAYLWKSGHDMIDLIMMLEDRLKSSEGTTLQYYYDNYDYNELERHDLECILEEIQLRREERKNV